MVIANEPTGASELREQIATNPLVGIIAFLLGSPRISVWNHRISARTPYTSEAWAGPREQIAPQKRLSKRFAPFF